MLEDAAAAAYIAWCELQHHPENTIRRRRTVLRAVGNPGTATREELEAWWTNRTHLADTSRANELAILRSFYRWCQIWEHRLDDPTVRLQPPTTGSGAPRPATRRELDLILEHLKTRPKDGAQLRRAVLLGVWGGFRISEAAHLQWSHIDPDTRRARVEGKGRKTRTVKLSMRLLEELLPDSGGNVVTGRARGWAADTLGHKINAAIHVAVPLEPDLTFHKLRHRYGSLGYQRTKDPKALAELMGHASVSTTMTFYAAAADDAADAIADAVADD